MDPKKISSLDPKLRETYERIMGTSTPGNQSPTPTTPNAPIEPVQKQTEPQIETTISQAKPISGFMQEIPTQTPTAKEELPPLPPIMQTQTVQELPLSQNLNMNSPIPQEVFTKSPFTTSSNNSLVNPNPSPEEVTGNRSINQPSNQKKKNKLLPILLLLGSIIFFVVYTVVWAKVFSLF